MDFQQTIHALLIGALLWHCGDDSAAPDAGVDAGADALSDTSTDGGPGDRDGDGIDDDTDLCPDRPEDIDGDRDEDGCPDEEGTLPDPPDQSGVAIVADFTDGLLRFYRTDGASPRADGELDLGEPTRDLAIDRYNDLLAVVEREGGTNSVRLFALTRPADASAAFELTQASTLTFDDTPIYTAFHPQRDQLLVLESPPLPEMGPITENLLSRFDVSDPSNPTMVGTRESLPATSTRPAIDSPRDILFLYESRVDRLHLYDLGSETLREAGGSPIDVRAAYPQDQPGAGFVVRNFAVDSARNRVVAVRSQTILSELVAFEYPAYVPPGDATPGSLWTDVHDATELSVVADGFDVDIPFEERPNILGAWSLDVDVRDGSVFMSADAFGTATSQAIAVGFETDLGIRADCADNEGFGCWLHTSIGGVDGANVQTDGALCIDAVNDRVVFTSLPPGGAGMGGVHVLDVVDDGTAADVLPEDGNSLRAGALPVDAVCF